METLHIVLLSSPGKGHLIPVVELGKRLVTRFNYRATVITVANDVPISSQSQLSNHLQIIPLPSIDLSSIITPTTSELTVLEANVRLSIPAIRSAISAMEPPPSVLITDYFSVECLSIAAEFNMAKYVFVPSNALCLAMTAYYPHLTKTGELPETFMKVPGCSPIRFVDLIGVMHDPNTVAYADFVRIASKMLTADGILNNTWEGMEPTTIAALRENEDLKSAINSIPVYPIGPLIRADEPFGSESQVVQWLDKQPTESVLYVSFGSNVILSTQQFQELAWGLEMSQQRFIWVIRPPTENGECDYLQQLRSGGTSIINDNPNYLPNGFVTRTRDVGLLVSMWAPQAEVLAHPSVGGFLSHCGWNSTLESMANGVPMIAWPMFAEQNMTAEMLAVETGVAIRAMEPGKGLVIREEIEKMVRKLFVEKEGKEMRKKAKELKRSGEEALSKGGTSYNSMSLLAKRWSYGGAAAAAAAAREGLVEFA